MVSPTIIAALAFGTAICSLANSLVPLVDRILKKNIEWEKVGGYPVSRLLSTFPS